MNFFDKQIVMEFFLDNDSVSTVNRLAIAMANVVSENNDNINKFNELVMKNNFIKAEENIAKEFHKSHKVTRRNRAYFEQNIVCFSDDDYLYHFKMRKSTVQALISFLREHTNPSSSIVPLDKKVHLFLWILTTDASYNEIGALFGLHKSSVSYIFYEISSFLTEQRFQFINWPSLEEQNLTRVKVFSRFKFPNCVGFIDACRFKVGSKRNKRDKPDTVLLQAVCDESLMFTDIHVGDIGRTRKNKLFRESKLSEELKNYIDFDSHILGNSEYRLRKNLITPFTSEELLTSEEMKFNELHWKARSYIGHAFELLKERFKRLNYIDVTKTDTLNILITAACVLHNFILLHEGSVEIKEEKIICNEPLIIDTNIVKTAMEKRQFLCNYMNYMDVDD